MNFLYPAEVKPGQDRLRVLVGKVSADTAKDLGARGTLNRAITTTLMGLGTDPIGTKSRTILGQDGEAGIRGSGAQALPQKQASRQVRL